MVGLHFLGSLAPVLASLVVDAAGVVGGIKGGQLMFAVAWKTERVDWIFSVAWDSRMMKWIYDYQLLEENNC